MSIVPKSWATFQHYKDRSPAWIKLHRGLLDDFDFARLPVASRALAPLLWLLASEYERGEITASLDEIAFRFRMPVDELGAAIKPLIDKGFFTAASDVLAECKQVAIPEREKEEERELEKEKTIGRSQARRAPIVDKDFQEFWKSYPKRDGANPKAPARKLFLAAVKAGTEPAVIVAGAQACALKDREKIGTPFIPQAVKWLRDRRWEDYGGPALSSTGPPPGWKPGMPTSEELRAKYEREQSNGGEGNSDRLEQASSVDEGGEGLRGAKPGVFRGESRDGRIQKLGDVLRENGVGAMGVSPAEPRRSTGDGVDGPVPMARVVHG